jgi:hypothetical protein
MARLSAPAAAPPQRQRYARLIVLGPVLVLAGLLLGSALAFGYEQFFAEELRTAAAESQTIKLRRHSAARLEDQLTGRFWFPLCDETLPDLHGLHRRLPGDAGRLGAPIFLRRKPAGRRGGGSHR